MVAALTREEWIELQRLEWRDAVRRGEPQAKCDALELRWREEALPEVEKALDFIPRVSPRLKAPFHLRPLAQFFVDAESGPTFICTSVPPQHGKTVSIAHLLVRYMMRFPEKRNAYVSYADERAKRVARQMLEVAIRAGLRLRIANRGEWVTPEGGSLIITGIGGPIIGEPIDGIFVVDDAHKDRFEANSPTIRQMVIDYVTITAASRLHPCASFMVNGTRWHLFDVIGTIEERERVEPVGWKFINLPAIGDGCALWPEERPLNFLEKKRRIMGDYDFCAQYMGQPIPEGGALFNRPAARYQRPDVSSAVRIIACDPAATAKTSADKSAIVVAAATVDDDGFMWMDILDVRTMQVEMPALVGELLAVQRTWRAPIVVEAVGGFKGVPDMIKSLARDLDVAEIQPKGDKKVRAQRVAAAWNDGRVRVPMDAPWVDRFTTEVGQFTGVGDAHDDQVDALAHAWNTAEKLLQVRDLDDVAAEIARGLPHGGF